MRRESVDACAYHQYGRSIGGLFKLYPAVGLTAFDLRTDCAPIPRADTAEDICRYTGGTNLLPDF